MAYDPRKHGARCDECPLKGHRPVPAIVAPGQLLGIISKSPNEEEVEKNQLLIGTIGKKIRKAATDLLSIPEGNIQYNSLLLCRPPDGMKAAELNVAYDCCKGRLADDLRGVGTVLTIDKKANHLFTGKVSEDDWMGAPAGGALFAAKRGIGDPIWTGQCLPAFNPTKAFSKPSLWPVLYVCFDRAWDLARGRLGEFQWPEIVMGTGPAVQAAMRRLIDNPKEFLGVDIETAGTDPLTVPITAIGVANKDLSVSLDWTRANAAERRLMKEILEGPAPKVLHNGAYDIVGLKAVAKIRLNNFAHDTMLMHTAVAPDLKHSLGFMAMTFFPAPRWKAEFGMHSDEKGDAKWTTVDPELLAYNAKDAWMTVKSCIEMQNGHLDNRAAKFADTLLKLSILGTKMQEAGIAIDPTAVRWHWKNLRKRQLRAKKILMKLARIAKFGQRKVGKAFRYRPYNPDSNQDSAELFFKILKAPVRRRSKKPPYNPSLNDDALRTYLYGDELKLRLMSRALLRYRGVSTLRRNTVKAMMGKTTIHPFAKVNGGGATGRWSYKPAMQNWEKTLRNMIVARPGYWLLEADKKQLEARIAAALNVEPKLLAAIQAGLNIHKVNQANIFGKDSLSNKELYHLCKTAFFASLYLAPARTAWQRLIEGFPDLPLADIERFQTSMFTAYPQLRQGPINRQRQATKDDYIEIPGSHHRYYFYGEPPSINACANIPVQGFGAHRLNTEIQLVAQRIDWKFHRMLLQVHDALIFETNNPSALVTILEECMNGEVDFGNGVKMPLPVEFKIGHDWREMAAFDDQIGLQKILAAGPFMGPR